MPSGAKIGLVGRSGGGKTTLTRLLLRMTDIDAGRILIGGQDISRLRQADLRGLIAYVPQDPAMFHRTLRDNIAFARPDATDAEIRRAAEAAHVTEFADALPDGFDTMVGERGVKLSGGQRQRVALARAILRDAPILLLDEATSALDSESEILVQEALWRLMDGRTALVVAHRLSTVAGMDRLVVLDRGRIVEQGTHHGTARPRTAPTPSCGSTSRAASSTTPALTSTAPLIPLPISRCAVLHRARSPGLRQPVPGELSGELFQQRTRITHASLLVRLEVGQRVRLPDPRRAQRIGGELEPPGDGDDGYACRLSRLPRPLRQAPCRAASGRPTIPRR